MTLAYSVRIFDVMAGVSSQQAVNRHWCRENPILLGLCSAQRCFSSLSEREPPIPFGRAAENECPNSKSDRLLGPLFHWHDLSFCEFFDSDSIDHADAARLARPLTLSP